MPHKRSKKSIRDVHTAHLGYDNAPTATDSIAIASTSSSSAATQATTSSSSSTPAATVLNEASTVGGGVLAPKPKMKKKLAPKDKLNSFGGRKDLGGLSKSAHRIFNAAATREEYHEGKKRKREEEDKAALKKNPKKPLVPLPYESLPAFNRRVEIALRPSIDTAIRGAKAAKKLLAVNSKKKKVAPLDPSQVEADALAGKGKGKVSPQDSIDPLVPPVRKEKVRNGPTEFKEASQKRSITDVAQAPPTLKKAKRGLESNVSTSLPIPIGRMPVSDSLKKIMEVEREKAVKMYRLMKEKRDKEQREEHA